MFVLRPGILSSLSPRRLGPMLAGRVGGRLRERLGSWFGLFRESSHGYSSCAAARPRNRSGRCGEGRPVLDPLKISNKISSGVIIQQSTAGQKR